MIKPILELLEQDLAQKRQLQRLYTQQIKSCALASDKEVLTSLGAEAYHQELYIQSLIERITNTKVGEHHEDEH